MPEQKICKALKKSPLFQLSLASKELFHTNFLYWLATTDETKPLFLNFLSRNGINISGQWEVRREYLHLDLCLTAIPKKNKKGEELPPEILLVIENKVKSIATKSQLVGYQDVVDVNNKSVAKRNKSSKVLCKFILLTLAEFEQKVTGWVVCDYKKLADSLDLKVISCPDITQYQKDIIEDYKGFIGNLHQLSRLWTLDVRSKYFPSEECLKLYDDLRLNDLFEKQRFNQMVELLIGELGKKSVVSVRGGDISPIKNESLPETFLKNHKDKVYIHHDYTNGKGLLDIKIVAPAENYIVGIQLQGNQYRHYVQYPLKFKKDFSGTLQLPFILKMDFFGNVNAQILPDVNKISGDQSFHIRKKKGNPPISVKDFCKFGDTFFYRYLTIKDAALIEDVLTLICKDIEWVLSCK